MNEDRPVLSATELYSPLNVLFNSALYRLDYVDICWAFLRYRFAIRIQWVKWQHAVLYTRNTFRRW